MKKGMAVLAVLSGIVCALSVFAYTDAVRSEASAARADALEKYGGDQLEVCVATRDIAPGETIDSSNIAMRQWVVDLLPAGAVRTFADVSGKQAASAVLAGEVLSEKRFEKTALDIAVPAGLQAVSVELGEAQAVGGALAEGAHVDVYAVGATGASLLEPGVLVAAVGSESGSRRWVTLAARPACVEEIIATTQKASIYLALPSQGEGSGHGA